MSVYTRSIISGYLPTTVCTSWWQASFLCCFSPACAVLRTRFLPSDNTSHSLTGSRGPWYSAKKHSSGFREANLVANIDQIQAVIGEFDFSARYWSGVVGCVSNLARSNIYGGFPSVMAPPGFLSLAGTLHAPFVVSQACFYKVQLCRAPANCFSCVFLVIGDTVASNCCRNVLFRLKSSLKLCLFLPNCCGFDLIIRSKNISRALIEAYCAALNRVFCRRTVNAT